MSRVEGEGGVSDHPIVLVRVRESPSANEELELAAASARDVLTYDELFEGVLGPIRRGTACSGISLCHYDEQGIVRCLGGTLAEARQYAVELFHLDPIQDALLRRKLMPHAVVPRLLPEVDWASFQRGAAYNELCRPHGVEDLLGINLSDEPYGSPGTSGVLLTRSNCSCCFETSTRDKRVARPRVACHLDDAECVVKAERVRRIIGVLGYGRASGQRVPGTFAERGWCCSRQRGSVRRKRLPSASASTVVE